MFEENKNYSEYVKDKSVFMNSAFGAQEVRLVDIVESISEGIPNDRDFLLLIQSLDAITQDAEFTENLAKRIIGSWLNVVKSCAKEDKEWCAETKEFLNSCIGFLEDNND